MNYIKTLRSLVGRTPIILNFAACCVVNDRGEVLLQRRGDGKKGWGFPGGAVEFGESLEEAAIRETIEETGLTVRIAGILGTYSKYFGEWPDGTAQTIVTFFMAEVVSGEFVVDGDETLALQFFSPDALPPLFNVQHQQAADDFIQNRRGVVR